MKLRLYDRETKTETLAWSVDAIEATRYDPGRYVILTEGEAAPDDVVPAVPLAAPAKGKDKDAPSAG